MVLFMSPKLISENQKLEIQKAHKSQHSSTLSNQTTRIQGRCFSYYSKKNNIFFTFRVYERI